MIGERENKNIPNTDYGTLHMRAFAIDGNEINAFYDSSDNLVFVLDNTIRPNKPNVLLVMNSDGDRKWDEILSDDYDVDLETIRPKQDNKYQKLDIEYSGLNVYEKLINAYNNGDSLDDELNQLNVLRDSAVRHSAMARLNTANEIINKTNTTIVKTRETIVRLNDRVKSLRAKLSSAKKEIGRVETKQSASRILKLESQIDATNEKLKRAKKRLESAQKRLDIATADAELASELLNQPAMEIKQNAKNKPVMVAPKHEVQKIEPVAELEIEEDDDEDADFDKEDDFDDENNDVKPLFNDDPQILNNDIAFKPISFESPTVPELPEPESHEEIPYLDNVFVAPEIKDEPTAPEFQPVAEEKINERPVLESLSPIENVPEITPNFESEPIVEQPSVLENMTPIARQPEPEVMPELEPAVEENEQEKPVANNNLIAAPMSESLRAEIIGENNAHKPTLIYYLLLIVLIALSVFTLWLYQKNVENTSPMLTANVVKTTVLKKTEKPKKVVEPVNTPKDEKIESVFLDENLPSDNIVASVEPQVVEPVVEFETEVEPEIVAPAVMDVVPARMTTSGESMDEDTAVISEEEVLANKPIYEPGAKHDAMFVADNPEIPEINNEYEYYDDKDIMYVDENDPFYDAEEAEYN